MRLFPGIAFPFFLAALLGLVSCGQEAPPAVAPSAPPAPAAPADKPVQIPQITDAGGDWAKQAHQVLILNPVDNTPGAKVELALAWTPSAFLLQVHTDDVTLFETPTDPWTGDAVGFNIASSPGSDDALGFVCAPNRLPGNPQPAWRFEDQRTDAPKAIAPTVQVTHDDKGYTMTVSLPWANFKHVPRPGEVIALQVCVNDAKGADPLSHRTWFPTLANGPLNMERVQLAAQADPPETALARIHPKGFHNVAVEVLGVPESAGKAVVVWSGGNQLASGTLTTGGFDGDSTADLALPPELAAQKDAVVQVTVDGQPLPTALKVPDLAATRLMLLKDHDIVAGPAIFSGNKFPPIHFRDSELMDEAVGPYTMHLRFFDANWNEVTSATSPGRYGARVEVRTDDGLTCTREITLFKTPGSYVAAKEPYAITAKFPASFGLPDDLAAQEQWNISNSVGRSLEKIARDDNDGAVLAAALHDIQTDPAHCRGFEAWKIDSDWWTELHKRLGEDQEYHYLTHLPDDYDKDQRAWPLILFLHGSGERGDDLAKVKNQGPLGYINKGHPLPFIVITPQCPAGTWWETARLAHLLDEVCAANRVDPKRIYVTGLSMGGYGTLDLAGTYPDRFAAIAPDAGGENPALAGRLRKMPAWFFHGSEDTVVPTRYSLDLVAALQKVGAPVKLTLYPGLGHGGWETTYSNPELYTWFLAHSK